MRSLFHQRYLQYVIHGLIFAISFAATVAQADPHKCLLERFAIIQHVEAEIYAHSYHWINSKTVRGRLQLRSMDDGFYGERFDGVYYLNDVEIQKQAISVKEGKLVDVSGKPITNSTHTLYIMDCQGQMYSSHEFEIPAEAALPGFKRIIKHSSLGQGAPVAGAGDHFIKNGDLQYITNHSGHYAPDHKHLAQTVKELHRQGVNLSKTRIYLYGIIPRSEEALWFLNEMAKIGIPAERVEIKW